MEAGEKINELRAAIAVAVQWSTSIRNKQIEELEQNELPRLLGRLISDLDLQREFIAMGKHVRSFADAQVVIGHLMPVMEERLDTAATVGTWKLLDDIVAMCRQVEISFHVG